MTNKSNKSRADRERAAKMRSAYTNPYKTVSAAQRRIKEDVQAERAEGGSAWRERRDAERRAKQGDGPTHEMIQEALHNPTKSVTEAELREQYNHVVADLRSMAMLAAGLVVVLVSLAFLLPR